MTISRRQVGAFAFLAFGTNALPAFAETNDQAAVAEAVAALTKAMLGADRAKLESLVSDNLSYGHSGGAIQDKKDFVDVIANKKTVYKSIELSKQTVAVAGNNAIVRHAWKARAAPATASGTYRRSACCRSGRRSRAAGSCWRGKPLRSDLPLGARHSSGASSHGLWTASFQLAHDQAQMSAQDARGPMSMTRHWSGAPPAERRFTWRSLALCGRVFFAAPSTAAAPSEPASQSGRTGPRCAPPPRPAAG